MNIVKCQNFEIYYSNNDKKPNFISDQQSILRKGEKDNYKYIFGCLS